MFRLKKRRMTKGSREVKGQWLQDELDRLKLKGAAVGKQLGCDPTKIYNHLKDETKLQAGLLAALWIEFPQIDMRYVLTGKREEDVLRVVTVNEPVGVKVEVRKGEN